MTNKLLPVALIAALVGGSVGALVMYSKNQPTAVAGVAQDTPKYDAVASQPGNDQFIPAEFNKSDEQSAYKVGFADGLRAAGDGASGTRSLAPAAVVTQPTRVVYRNTGRRYARSSNSRPVYYSNQQQPRGRSFWQKHRDKLTVAIGAGSGAAVGGLIGGKKGAAIGALAGGGGSALYTYKIRNRNRRY
ncbi:MAG: hypothetical protein H0V18_09570 [Pyrinomonadaceae bacterium]|nr:hypothetical protein [Pyrinomonadaceae bacterium]